jgi:hypothetical protein
MELQQTQGTSTAAENNIAKYRWLYISILVVTIVNFSSHVAAAQILEPRAVMSFLILTMKIQTGISGALLVAVCLQKAAKTIRKKEPLSTNKEFLSALVFVSTFLVFIFSPDLISDTEKRGSFWAILGAITILTAGSIIVLLVELIDSDFKRAVNIAKRGKE